MSLDDRVALHQLLSRMAADEKLATIGEIVAELRVRPETPTEEQIVAGQKAAHEGLMRKLEALPAPDPDRVATMNEHDQLIYGRRPWSLWTQVRGSHSSSRPTPIMRRRRLGAARIPSG